MQINTWLCSNNHLKVVAASSLVIVLMVPSQLLLKVSWAMQLPNTANFSLGKERSPSSTYVVITVVE